MPLLSILNCSLLPYRSTIQFYIDLLFCAPNKLPFTIYVVVFLKTHWFSTRSITVLVLVLPFQMYKTFATHVECSGKVSTGVRALFLLIFFLSTRRSFFRDVIYRVEEFSIFSLLSFYYVLNFVIVVSCKVNRPFLLYCKHWSSFLFLGSNPLFISHHPFYILLGLICWCV